MKKLKKDGRLQDTFNYAKVHRPVAVGVPEAMLGGGLILGAVGLGLSPLIAVPAAIAGVALGLHGAVRNGHAKGPRIDAMIKYDNEQLEKKRAAKKEKAARKAARPRA